jgi:hypothetical protein
MDKAVEYTQKVEKFVKTLTAEHTGEGGTHVRGDTWQVETGRKFDKVYVQTFHQGKPLQKIGRYMVDRNSWIIYGIKSWAQINPRRTYGTLDTVSQYDWTGYVGKPKPGTDAENLHNELEAQIAAGYKKRGRPRKVVA